MSKTSPTTAQLVRQTQFTTGEVDISTWKRTDAAEYLTAAQNLLNCEIDTIGVCRKRKGTTQLFNATGYATAQSRMYEFVDRYGRYYLILSAPGFMYVFGTPSNQDFVITSTGAFVITSTGANVVTNLASVTFMQTLVTPYQGSDLDDIDYTQDNDNLILAHPAYPPARIYISVYASDTTPTFAYAPLDIYPLPAYDFNQINYNNFTVALSVSGSTLTFQFTGLGSDPGFNSAWIGGQIIGGGASDTEPVGYAIITNVSYSGGTTTFTATVQIPFQTSGYATSGNQYSVRQPAWSAALGYPSAVLFFQNRLWLANTPTLNNAIFGSKINQPVSFDVGTGRDSDAIVYTLGQTNSGAIIWLNGGKQLEIFTQNYEYACPQDQNSALTPSTFAVRQQSSYGASSSMKPITYINDSYYLSRTGNAIVNFHYNGIGLTYSSSNISAASSHLVKAPSNRALLRGDSINQDNFIYFINQIDNTITAFQFASETSLAALTPITFESNVHMIDITSIDNVIYILKFYSLTNQFTVEVFDINTRMDNNNSYSMNSSGLVTGLAALNGYTVQVLYANQDFGQYLVSGGQITVTNPGGVSGGVQVGLLYDVMLTPMYVFAGANASPYKKLISRIYVDYYNSLNFTINGFQVPYQTYAQIQAGLPLTPQTGTEIIGDVSGWERFGTLTIAQTSPFDLNITAIGYQITVANL